MVFSWIKEKLGAKEKNKGVTKDLLVKELIEKEKEVSMLKAQLMEEKEMRKGFETELKGKEEQEELYGLKKELKEELLVEIKEDLMTMYQTPKRVEQKARVKGGQIVVEGQELELGYPVKRFNKENKIENKKGKSIEDYVKESKRGRKKRTTEDVAKEVEELTEGEYELVSGYEHSLKPVKIKHKKCGKVIETQIGNFRTRVSNGVECECEEEQEDIDEVEEEQEVGQVGRKKRASEDVAEEVKELTDGEYELVGEYTGSKNTIKVRHIACGREYDVYLSNFRRDIKNGRECVCKEEREEENFKKAVREGGLSEDDQIKNERVKRLKVENRIRNVVGEEYTLMSNYNNQYDNVTLRHNVCGRDIVVQMSNFLYKGYRCKDCTGTISKGEKKIKDYLDTYYPKSYVHQRRELIGEDEHFYDFLIIDQEGKHLGYIEFNGEQHYKAIDYFGGSERYKEQKRRDQAKRDFAKSKGLSMLELSYKLKDNEWAFELDKYLQSLGYVKEKVNYEKELEDKRFDLLSKEGDNLTIKCQGCKGEQVIKHYEVHDYLKCTYCGSRVKK